MATDCENTESSDRCESTATKDGTSATKCASVYVLNHDNCTADTIRIVTETIKAKPDAEQSLMCLGPQGTSLDSTEPVLTPCEYLLRLLRQFSLHRNEREMLLSEEDQRVAVQLCLAEKNKQVTGEFDVEVSRVLEYNKRLQKAKLTDEVTKGTSDLDSSLIEAHLNSSIAGFDVDFDEFQEQYSAFLKTTNCMDIMDLIRRLEGEMEINEELKNSIQGQNILLLQPPQGLIQGSMFNLLAREKEVHWVRITESLEGAEEEQPSPVTADQVFMEPATAQDILNTTFVSSCRMGNRVSVTEAYVEKLMLGYIHLLVNSRSEIALARVINVPERELDHKAFTDLKRQAQTKSMSMYQTAVSYVMKIRLGGRSYAPDPNCCLAAHVKGLGDFTDLAHKLQTILEEIPDHRKAVNRVLTVIKNTIIKCQDNTIRRQSVENVKQTLQDQAGWVIDNMEKHQKDSPQRNASAGGSLVGRQTIRVLRWILDHASAQPCTVSALDSLTDIISSQRTPLRFPSIMSKFRSPIECSPEAKENLSLVQRLKDKYPAKKTTKAQYGSCMDWAKPLHDVGFSADDSFSTSFTEVECLPSATVAHPASCSENQLSKPLAARILESARDQENADSRLNPSSDSAQEICSSQKLDCSKSSESNKPSNKRPLADSNQIQPNKKAKIQSMPSSQATTKTKSKPSKVSKKKIVPLQKGQKTIGAFFRV